MEEMKNTDFDPDFSEYNPIMSELERVKKVDIKANFKEVLADFIDRLNSPVYIPLD